jgi:hypothetical protein
MNAFEKLYKEDQKQISLWEKNYTDREFYNINRRIRKQLEVLIANRRELSPREHFISAMIYHHGFTIKSSKKALRHIKIAQKRSYNKQKWLIASIIDRLLQLEGKPQKYGTQIVKLRNGKYKQYRLDNSISDKERTSLGLPKLKNLKKSLEN